MFIVELNVEEVYSFISSLFKGFVGLPKCKSVSHKILKSSWYSNDFSYLSVE